MKNNSLLNKLDSFDIKSLIAEQQLIDRGYKIIYIVDPDEYSNYCFPFGLASNSKDKREKKPLEIATDEQIAYYSLFNSKYNFLVLKEHLIEVKNFKKEIDYHKYLGITITDTFKLLLQKYYDIKKQKKVNIELFKDFRNIADNISEYQISLFLSIAIGSLRNGIEKLNQLESNGNLLLSEDEINIPEISDQLIEFIISSKPKEFSIDLYNQIISAISDENINISRKLSYNRDCEVIDRLTQFNNKAVELNEKILFLYLSSTNKSKHLYLNFKNELSISIEEFKFVPLRSVSQEFLKIISHENDSKGIIKKYEEILEIFIAKEASNNYNIPVLRKNLEKFEVRISEKRQEFKNSSLILQFDSFQLKALLHNSIKNSSKILKPEVVLYLQDILKLADYNNEIEKISELTLTNIRYERNFLNILLEGVTKIENESEKSFIFRISSGEDPVSNLHHHFPIVFFIKRDKTIRIVDEIIKFYLNSSPSKHTSSQLIRFINKSISLLFIKTSFDEEKIIRLLIYLMLPSINNENPEIKAFARVSEIIENEIENSSDRTEFLYIASWIARRITKYDKSIELAKKGLAIRNDDPRFYHALALAYYCKYEENEENINHLRNSIKNCDLAIKNYREIDNGKLEIKKSIIAVVNAQAFFYCLLYEHFREAEYLAKARHYLNELIQIEKKYNTFPEFLHTIAIIEFYEYEYEKSIDKLLVAYKSVKQAIKYNPKNSYRELSFKIEKLLPTKYKK